MPGFIGDSNKAKKLSKIYVGVGDKAKEVKSAFVGVNNKAKKVYSSGFSKNEFVLKLSVPYYSHSTSFIIKTCGAGKIDFGDGDVQSINDSSLTTRDHRYYGSNTTYYCKISGNFTELKVGDGYQNHGIGVEVLTPLPASFSAITDYSGFFQKMTGLTAICSDLFINCPNGTNFMNFANGCTALASIPEGLFDSCTNAQNFVGAFKDCTAITSNVPELWDTTKWQNVNMNIGCFRNCTNAANYNDIPSSWK